MSERQIIGEILKTRLEPENVVDRLAVALEKEGQIVGHLNKVNSGRFSKTIFYFLYIFYFLFTAFLETKTQLWKLM